MALHDAELIQRTLEGDESAFGFLVDKYKGSVHALAYRKLGDFHTAEEITQDTFLKAYQKLSTLKDPGRFPGWLYVIAARCCISWLRRNRVQVESFDNVKREMSAQSWTKYADARLREEVHNALESLPESERTVLTLYYMVGMTCEEIGRFIGTSCGAIRDRLYRARIRLKEELTMIEETLGGFQLPPTLTQEIMRQIPNGSLNPTPTTGKPLAPWIVATCLTVVVLLIGLGIKQATTFQLPYSFNALESATMVEIVDAPIIEMPPVKFLQVNRVGG
ncbi:RNA polymerase sigma factor, partial [Candidatus Poribacteria bacterium]|nr:RNA polymerase sigma factor [Candidatus Poribacteria bacterium]